MHGLRSSTRASTRKCWRWATRVVIGSRPNDLRESFRAFSRALVAKRRLARLAPALFDESVIHRMHRDWLNQIRRNREIAQALAKVYEMPLDEVLSSPIYNETFSTDGERRLKLFRRLPIAKQGKIMELAAVRDMNWELAMEKSQRFFRMRRHGSVSATQYAKTLEIALGYCRFAAGLLAPSDLLDPPRSSSLMGERTSW